MYICSICKNVIIFIQKKRLITTNIYTLNFISQKYLNKLQYFV